MLTVSSTWTWTMNSLNQHYLTIHFPPAEKSLWWWPKECMTRLATNKLWTSTLVTWLFLQKHWLLSLIIIPITMYPACPCRQGMLGENDVRQEFKPETATKAQGQAKDRIKGRRCRCGATVLCNCIIAPCRCLSHCYFSLTKGTNVTKDWEQ